jgi:CIC family chloride channel protein
MHGVGWAGRALGPVCCAWQRRQLAATTHGPISAVVLIMELTDRDRSFILPLLLAVGTATVVARTIDRRSIYDARFTDEEVRGLQEARAPSAI